MGRRKVSTSVYLDPADLARLKTLAARTKVPVAAYVREGVDLACARHAPLRAEQRAPPEGDP